MDKLDIFFIQRDDAGLRAQVEGQTLGMRLKSYLSGHSAQRRALTFRAVAARNVLAAGARCR